MPHTQRTVTSKRSKKRKKKRLRERLYRLLFAVGILVILFAGIGLLSHLTPFEIEDVIVSGTVGVDEKVVESAVKQELAGSIALFYAKDNRFIYPKQLIKDELSARIPRLKTIDLSMVQGRQLLVSVTEYEGEYLWCGGTLPDREMIDERSCYFVDETGYIFDDAPYFSGDVYFKFYGGIVPPAEPIGSYVVRPTIFNELIQFKEFLPEIGVSSASFHLQDSGVYELYLKSIDSPKPIPKLIFNRNDSFQTVLTNLKTVLETEAFQVRFEESFDSLEYIDLRYAGQVIYKFNE